MKDNAEKDLELVRRLSKLMTEEKIVTLKYEKSGLKLFLDKNFNNDISDFKDLPKIKNSKTENENPKKNLEFNSNHPGALKAPMVGTAYTSPEPGKPPFIRLGDTVKVDQPLLIIEAMKVMNTINATKNGKIVFIGFEDAEPIEFEQLLVIIE